MKKHLCVGLAFLLIFLLSACAPKEEKTPEVQSPTVARTFEMGENENEHTWVTYYEMSDGTWKTDSYAYKYRLELEGDFAKITVLSNRDDITYSEAFMNLGFSSRSADYFVPEDAAIVRVVYNTQQ